jgi:hypothetical protein
MKPILGTLTIGESGALLTLAAAGLTIVLFALAIYGSSWRAGLIS